MFALVVRLEVPSWVRPPKRRDGKPWVLHLPDDGVLLSPMVEVFRDGTNDGYAFRDAVTVLAAVVPPGVCHDFTPVQAICNLQ